MIKFYNFAEWQTFSSNSAEMTFRARGGFVADVPVIERTQRGRSFRYNLADEGAYKATHVSREPI